MITTPAGIQLVYPVPVHAWSRSVRLFPLVCSLMRRATTAAATWKRLEARLRQDRAYLSQPPLFDLTASARCGVLCSGAEWHAHRRARRRREASGMNRLLVATSCAALAGAAATGAYIGVVTGRLTLDLGIGRRTRPLPPSTSTLLHPARLSSPPLPLRTPIDSRGPWVRRSRSSNALVRWCSPRTAALSDPV
jgi:hypothetical protein